MTDRPLITATLICRDEVDNVARLLDGIFDHVDELVVVDTGSSDGTVQAFNDYAAVHGDPEKLIVEQMDWQDDFAAARNRADELATGQWLLWADLDDTVEGLAELRTMAQTASEQTLAFFCQYVYATDPAGNIISELWRERLSRNDGVPWEGRLHEHKVFTGSGQMIKVDPSIARWIHHRDHSLRTSERNLRILQRWDEEEPGQERVLWALGMELMAEQRHRDSVAAFAGALQHRDRMPADRVSQAVRLMCSQLMLDRRPDEARAACLEFLSGEWMFADAHLTLAELEIDAGRPAVAVHHAQTALQIGKPDTLLIVNPLQYTTHPRALMAAALAQMGQLEQAVRTGREVLEIEPDNPLVGQMLPRWQDSLKRQQTSSTMLALADVYVDAGEVAKAHRLLSDVPWFLRDDARIVARRVQVYRLMQQRHDLTVAPDTAADLFVARHLKAA